MAEGLFYYRVIEYDDGTWACRRGRTEYDRHTSLDAALAHIRLIASENTSAEIFVHHFDGRVTTAGASEEHQIA